MIDNQALVYASDKAGGKGKLDLYLTCYENGLWSKPVPYEFLNTEKNDEYISVPARGMWFIIMRNTKVNSTYLRLLSLKACNQKMYEC